MQIIITSQHINLGDSLRAYAEKSLEENISKYFAEAVSADVHVVKDADLIRTELVVRPKTGSLLRAVAASTDAYASFDAATTKLGQQLKRYKNKLVDHTKKSVELVPLTVIESDQEKEAVDTPIIIAEMQTELPTCSVSEAVMHMDLQGLPALLFKNAAAGEFNMVYRRADGNIGWINPAHK